MLKWIFAALAVAAASPVIAGAQSAPPSPSPVPVATPTPTARPHATPTPTPVPTATPLPLPTVTMPPPATPLPPLPTPWPTPSPLSTPVPLPTPAPSPTVAPLPTPLTLPADAPPQIIAVKVSDPVFHGGEVITGTVITSTNVAAVEIRLAGRSMRMPRADAGIWQMTYTMPHVPFFMRGHYTAQIFAYNTAGATAVQNLSVSVR